MSENRDFFTVLEATREVTVTPTPTAIGEIVPLAKVPDDFILTEEETKSLLKVQEYTRRGTIPAQLVTRLQMIEDVIQRGFDQLTEVKRGPFEIVRLSPREGTKLV